MLKKDIKKDNFKTNSTPLQGVRLTHSSAEASVMDVERRGKQALPLQGLYLSLELSGIKKDQVDAKADMNMNVG